MSPQFFDVKNHTLPCQYIREYPGATLEDQEATLQLEIKQYTPKEQKDASGAITIIGAHANGFPKELYEPLWDEMYQRSRNGSFAIRSIWIADAAHQGMSYVTNEDKLGNDPSWLDHTRDLLHMINHFRDQMPRPLVGIGHSMGAANLVNLSLMHPRLLSTLVLIDPVIMLGFTPPPGPGAPSFTSIARMSTFRRDEWPSRSAAASSFTKSPFYSSWDPRVLSLWNQYGLRDLPTATHPSISSGASMNDHPQQSKPNLEAEPSATPVTLTTPKHQEVFTFLRPNFTPFDPTTKLPITNRATTPDLDTTLDYELTHPFYRPESRSAFRNLPYLRPSTLYIFGSASELSRPERCQEKMDITGIGVGGSGGAKEGRVRDVMLEGVGHLIPMDVPAVCAQKASGWLEVEMKTWWEGEEKWKRSWLGKTKRERIAISREWEERIGGDPKWERKGGKL